MPMICGLSGQAVSHGSGLSRYVSLHRHMKGNCFQGGWALSHLN